MPNLTLLNEGFPVTEDEFDRVLDGDDDTAPILAHSFDHRGQGCAFARAGDSGHENQPLAKIAELLHDGLMTQFRDFGHMVRNMAKRSFEGTAIVVGVAAKSSQLIDVERKIQFQMLFQICALAIVENGHHQLMAGFPVQNRFINPLHNAVKSNHGWGIHTEVEV